MKYFQLLAFVIIVSFCAVAYSQREPVLNFFPLSAGDVWEYKVVDIYSFDSRSSGYNTVDILGDTVCPNGKTYHLQVYHYYLGGYSSALIRVDSSNACVYDYTNGQDVLQDSLAMSPGDSMKLDGSVNVLYCDSVDTESIFGAEREVKEFHIRYDAEDDTRTEFDYSTGIGMTRWLSSSYSIPVNRDMMTWTLVYARIDGISYGNLAGVQDAEQAASTYWLAQNYPNPCNPTTVISFDIPEQSYATLTVYDALGRRVVTLVDKEEIPGRHEAVFDGSRLPSGVYFYRLQAGSYSAVRKLLLIK